MDGSEPEIHQKLNEAIRQRERLVKLKLRRMEMGVWKEKKKRRKRGFRGEVKKIMTDILIKKNKLFGFILFYFIIVILFRFIESRPWLFEFNLEHAL